MLNLLFGMYCSSVSCNSYQRNIRCIIEPYRNKRRKYLYHISCSHSSCHVSISWTSKVPRTYSVEMRTRKCIKTMLVKQESQCNLNLNSSRLYGSLLPRYSSELYSTEKWKCSYILQIFIGGSIGTGRDAVQQRPLYENELNSAPTTSTKPLMTIMPWIWLPRRSQSTSSRRSLLVRPAPETTWLAIYLEFAHHWLRVFSLSASCSLSIYSKFACYLLAVHSPSTASLLAICCKFALHPLQVCSLSAESTVPDSIKPSKY